MRAKAHILLYDIETAPLISANWGIWEQNAVWVIKDWYMLSFAYKWLGEKQVHVLGIDDFKTFNKDKENDFELVSALHNLFLEADVVIAHNGDSFDQKMTNTRFMVHKLGPVNGYKQIDTKKVAKRYARFTSNRLDDLGKALGLGQKLSTGGAELWRACMRGDREALKKMKRYNKQDVILLEQLYLELRPWIQNHPAMNNLLNRPDACPNCGEGPLHSKGQQVSKTSTYRRWQCQNCGAYSRSRIAEKKERMQYV